MSEALIRIEAIHFKDKLLQRIFQNEKDLSGEEMMRQKIKSIHQDLVKRSFVDETAHWQYSSAGDYATSPGLLEVYTAW